MIIKSAVAWAFWDIMVISSDSPGFAPAKITLFPFIVHISYFQYELLVPGLVPDIIQTGFKTSNLSPNEMALDLDI